MLLDNGGRVTTSTASKIGDLAGSVGDVEVSGAGSEWTNTGLLDVGFSGSGTVKVLNGGRIATTGSVRLGFNSASRADVIVDGDGSVWNISNEIQSLGGQVHVTISNGGLITNTSAPFWGTTGQLTLASGGRLQTSQPSGMSNQGLISGSGTVDSSALTNSGRLQTSSGDKLVLTGTLTNGAFVDLAGGELDVTGATTNSLDIDARDATIRFGGTGLSNNSGGELAITTGTVDLYGAVNNKAGAQIVVGQGAHGVFHDAVTNGGQLFVFPGGNVLMLESLSSGTGSSLNLQLAGTSAGSGFGDVDVSGTASLAGTLAVSFASGYAPNSGDTFRVLNSAAGVSGTFSSLTLPPIAVGLSWTIVYAANSVTLAVVPGIAGDYNQNGVVDAADYVVWRKGFGTTYTQNDYNVWRAHFGQTAGSGSGATASAAVPEPTTLVLLMFAAAGSCLRRRRST
jgi:T5SS/PEP-CTERM-associated repeat protein